jgi:transcriptional regulator with XRE-family HTH domain
MMKDIGNKIRMLRVNSRKKQRHLAEALGISIPAYSKILCLEVSEERRS